MNGAGRGRNRSAIQLLPLHGAAGAQEKPRFSLTTSSAAAMEGTSGYYSRG